MEQYYNKDTFTLSIPSEYNDELKTLPKDIKISV
jgi:hypothetical protein